MKKLIKVKNLKLSYKTKRDVLKNLSFDIEYKENVGIIGPIGAGKTTLLLCIAKLLEFEGEILVEDSCNVEDIRKKIGIIFQNPDDQLFMPNVYEDLAFGLIQMGLSEEEINDKINKVLLDLDIMSLKNRASHHLSLGEKKMVSIGTVLCMNPKIILMDEPSVNLDPYHRRKIINFIKSHTNFTYIIASHDLDFLLETTQKCILLNNGELILYDITKNILTNENLLKENRLELPLSMQKIL